MESAPMSPKCPLLPQCPEATSSPGSSQCQSSRSVALAKRIAAVGTRMCRPGLRFSGFADMGPSSTLGYIFTLIFVVVFHVDKVLSICLERDDQIQRYFISSKPPFDNYYNISKAVYPSVDLPSLLIKITVTFLEATDNVTQVSTTNMSNSKENETQAVHSRLTANVTRTYTWSISCLYVSGGDISITAMNVFSLWAIWPNRRERKLHLTLPQFCRGSPDDAPHNDTMIYFLSTVGIRVCGLTILIWTGRKF